MKKKRKSYKKAALFFIKIKELKMKTNKENLKKLKKNLRKSRVKAVLFKACFIKLFLL